MKDYEHCPICTRHIRPGQVKCDKCSIDALLDRVNAAVEESKEGYE